MTSMHPGDYVLLNGNDDLMMIADLRPYIGEVLEVEKVAKSGLVVLKVPPKGTISVPRRNLTKLVISGFPTGVGGTPITGPVQVFEDKFPLG